MTMPAVRTADASERDAVFATIVAAFTADPVTRFLWPDLRTWYERGPVFANAYGGQALAHGTAWVADDFAGVALWLPPGVEQDAEQLGRLGEGLPEARLVQMGEAMAALHACHPDGAHWFLPTIGVDPIHQGRGIGAVLMKAALERVDADGVPAYLESSNPRNITLYQRYGFEVVGEVQVPGGPLLTPMVRPAA